MILRLPPRALLLTASLAIFTATAADAASTLLNVSYDVTREFYKEFNTAFTRHWKATGGEEITINQSHGGSSKQVRSVLDGLQADVVTMSQATDLDVLAKAKLVAADWTKRFPMVRRHTPRRSSSWCGRGTQRESRIGAIW
jgi:sulfate transport system substrate-binding protein